MHRPYLYGLATLLLFANFTCPTDCDEFFFNDRNEIIVSGEVVNPQARYDAGDTITVKAEFPATHVGAGGGPVTISENGGLLLLGLYELDAQFSTLTPMPQNFIFLPPEDDTPVDFPAAFTSTGRLRYRCVDGTCTLNQRIRALVPGRYVLLLAGGPVDEISAEFNYCAAPSTRISALAGGGNLPEQGIEYPLWVPDFNEGFFSGRSLGQDSPDAFFFSVQ